MDIYNDDEIDRQDIECIRATMSDLGGEASLVTLARSMPCASLDYVAACLLVSPSDRGLPFALPSAYGRDAEGNPTWRVEGRWTGDDLQNGGRFLRARAERSLQLAARIQRCGREHGFEQSARTLREMQELRASIDAETP